MLYLHIPYCRKACTYCDFHFSTNLKSKAALVEGMVREIELRKGFFPEGSEMNSVYFGGGTPSVLTGEELKLLMAALRRQFHFSEAIEFTVECNPDDLSEAVLAQFKEAGVNRLSIGIQSFRDADLTLMNRSHSADQAESSVRRAQSMGFENITVDLIYGIPGMDFSAWQENVARAIELKVQHISAYALTVEEKTALHYQVQQGKVREMPDSAFETQYFYLIDTLKAAGFEQYELSNFARPGYRSRHNSAYWSGQPYLGVGPSAHSFKSGQRSWNIANNARYIQACTEDQLPIDNEEILSEKDRLNEYLMTHLRILDGVDLNRLKTEFKMDLLQQEGDLVNALILEDKAKIEEDHFRLTRAGLMISDWIIGELFQVD